MGKDDITVNCWLSDKERYADLFNGTLFGGYPVIAPEGLEAADRTKNFILRDKDGKEKGLSRYRDIVMMSAEGVNLRLLACETQEEVHYAMLVRSMLYDALNYAEQVQILREHNRKEKKLKTSAEFLSGLTKEDRLIPVITLIFYYGDGEVWDASEELYDLLDMNTEEKKRFLPFISNYKINLIEPVKIENLKCYKSDLQQILGVLKYKEDKEELVNYIQGNKGYFSHLSEETYRAVKVFMGSEKKLRDMQIIENPEGGMDMCKALEDLYQDGVQTGVHTGRENTILELLKEGVISFQIAAAKLEITQEELKARCR